MHLKLSIEESKSPLFLRVISHNIRYATGTPDRNERLWADRLPLIARQLRHEVRPFIPPEDIYSLESSGKTGELRTVFIGLQEVLHNQLLDVMNALNQSTSNGAQSPHDEAYLEEQWAYIGVARDDGNAAGEYGPILYQPNV